MPNARRLFHVPANLLFHWPIGFDGPLVLAEVLGPGIHKEGLNVDVRRLGVTVERPSRCAVTPAHAAEPMCGTHEPGTALGLNAVLDRDEHRSIVEIIAKVRHARG